jgi:GNAT superfamily N-acetyltransferase
VSVTIAPIALAHRADWERLFEAYAGFYKVPQTPAMRATVWAWLHDPAHEVNGLAALAEGRVVGIAHYRGFARPLRAATGIFIDDLFVDPGHRGGRVADALIGGVKSIATDQGHGVVRWITADDNYRGRSVYDRLATRTMWVTYDITL